MSKEKIPFFVEVYYQWSKGNSVRIEELEIVAESSEEAERLALKEVASNLVATAIPAKTWLAE